MSNKILMVAFDYPPSKSVAGQRTLRMTQYLPEFGWEPIILTAKPTAYDGLDYSQEIPSHMENKIFRTLALDVDRHLSIKGKHFNWMKMVDRWSTWIPGAILQGLRIIKQHKPDVIWSTYPTASAHIVANILAKKSQIPLVVDYQDPLAYIHKEVPKLKMKLGEMVDKAVLSRCSSAIFATEQAKNAYIQYYNIQNIEKFKSIENGFDESNFLLASSLCTNKQSIFASSKFSLYYSGVLYPDGRDPIPTFEAIARLYKEKIISEDNFELIFQGAGDGKQYAKELNTLNISRLVSFIPPVPFLDSIKNMLDATALLLIQDEIFHLQVPGKLFEYIRAMKPVLVASPANSATGQVAKNAQCGEIAHSCEQIYQVLNRWLEQVPTLDNNRDIENFSRYEKAKQLSQILNEISK